MKIELRGQLQVVKEKKRETSKMIPIFLVWATVDNEGIHTFQIKVKVLEGIFQEFNLYINISNSRPFVTDNHSD